MLITIATYENWDIRQLDTFNAFLQGKLEDTVYMKQPPSFDNSQHPNHVYRFPNSLEPLHTSRISSSRWNLTAGNPSGPSPSTLLPIPTASASPPAAPPWQFLSPRHSISHTPPQHPPPSLHYHCLISLHRQDGNIHAIALAARGRLVLTGSDSDRVRAWRQPGLEYGGLLRTRRPRVRALLAHGEVLFTAHADRRVRVWSVEKASGSASASSGARWRKVATLPPRRLRVSLFRRRQDRVQQQHREDISCLALYTAGQLLYTGSWDSTVKAWHVGDGTCVDSFVAHEGRVNAVVVGQDDGGVFTAGADGCVKVWRRVYGESAHALTMVLRFQASPVNALVVGGGGGSYVYSGSSDGYVNIWEREAATGRYHHGGFLQGHRYAVLCLAAVKRLILSGSEDTTIRVWRREEGSGFHVCLAVMEGHRGPVRCIAAAVESEMIGAEGGMGLLIYSASYDRMLKAWRLKVAAENQEKEKRKTAGDEEAEKEEEEEETRSPSLRMEGEGHGMTPVLSPLWVEKRLREIHLC
ncbi:protein JINGUBANG-like [Phalaenopsis equestris]|uniref:protein JINGUBANG-like n=1 Tax=Phalaenopsis equestris TaxID=78828 RepID=UPI0009E47295|nr:protein JINGUBANG-like [Phalaenopsis equestris]